MPEQFEWYCKQTSRRAMLRGGLAGARDHDAVGVGVVQCRTLSSRST
jgi:hypothetical protein